MIGTRKQHGFQAVQIATSHYRDLKQLKGAWALMSLCTQLQAGCCTTGTGESHSSWGNAIKAAYVPTLTYLNSQY